MQGRWLCCESICSNGYSLANSGYEWHSEITSCIDTLMDRWRRLKDGAATHRTLLHDAIEAQQVILFIIYCNGNVAMAFVLCISV